jgi:hypothetical protein
LFYPVLALCLAGMLATLGLILLRRRKSDGREVFRVRETVLTVALGILLWAEVLVIAYFGYFLPEQLFTNANTRINVVIFLIMATGLGSVALLYYFVKCIIVEEDTVRYIDIVGNCKSLKWADIRGLTKRSGKRLLLNGPDGNAIRVGGEAQAFQKFLRYAEKKILSAENQELLRQLMKPSSS